MVWLNDICDIDSECLLSFLFGGSTSSRVIDAFGDCLTRCGDFRDRPRVFVFPSFVQIEFAWKSTDLSKMAKLEPISKKAFLEEVVESFSHSARIWLNKIDLQSLETLDYIISPIHCEYHWGVMIYKVKERLFCLRDSLDQKRMTRATNSFVSLNKVKSLYYVRYSYIGYIVQAHFLSNYWAWMYDYKVNSKGAHAERTRRQAEEGVDCGVHAAMSMERYIVGPTGRGTYLDDVEVDVYRASMAATILRDELSCLNV